MNEAVEKRMEGMEVLDSETGKFVEITSEMRQMASYLHNQSTMGSFISAIAMKEILDKKLYLALGCTSKSEYIDQMTIYGRRQAYKLVAIASELTKQLPQLIQTNKTQNVHSSALTTENDANLQNLADIGISKLYQLTTLDDNKSFKELYENGKTTIGDAEYTIEEIKDMTAKEVTKQVSEIKKKYQDKLNVVTEEKKLLKSENDQLKKTIVDNESRISNAAELERKYGAKASLLNHKSELLKKANDLLNELRLVTFKINVTVDDPEGIQEDLISFVRKIDTYNMDVVNEFQEVTAQF